MSDEQVESDDTTNDDDDPVWPSCYVCGYEALEEEIEPYDGEFSCPVCGNAEGWDE